MTTLDRYITRAILSGVGLVMAVLLVVAALYLFIDEQNDIGVGNYHATQALWFVLLNLPQTTWELLPIAALIGALIGLGTLARGSELIVVRATGFSVMRLAGAALVASAFLIAIEVALGEFLAPPLQQAARHQKAFSKYADISFGSGGGAWVRDGNLILNVARQSGERQFGGMLVFELAPEHRLRAVGQATRATAGTTTRWLLSNYQESRFTSDRVLVRRTGERVLESGVSAGFLGLAVTEPRQLSLVPLWRVMNYYQANALDATPYVFAFWSRIARTVAIAFAVLLAVPFSLGQLRSAGAGTRTLIGLLLGVAFFLLQRLIESGTIVFQLDPVILAWLPTALLAMVSLTLLGRTR
ncbi:MAG TPA: LPS export ABC transporter permease LptG [Steroidobacteraceae bacterium]